MVIGTLSEPLVFACGPFPIEGGGRVGGYSSPSKYANGLSRLKRSDRSRRSHTKSG